MRADRLVAALLVLQARGRVTAAELAEELEVSERTARRDLEALAASGVPVYSQAGRGGGWSLIGGARTDLSGLTAAEARMLFLVAGPSSQATPQLKAALRKLVRALPESFRAGAQAAASAVVIDPASWDRTSAPPPEHLDALQAAVVDGVQTVIVYASAGGPPRERVVHPLGLVVKGTVWYLVANTDGGLRTFRVGRVRGVNITQDPVDRPDGFDLAEHWRSVMSELDERRAPVRVKLRAAPHAIGWLRAAFGTRMRAGDRRGDDRIDVEVRAHSPLSATAELAGFGANIEVLEPDEVRGYLARVGAELSKIYGSG
ncbi:MAG: helix-turn-helix transcriptional regulator [Actinomycetota bacterium]